MATRRRSTLRTSDLFVCKLPPAPDVQLFGQEVTQIPVNELPVFTVSSIQRHKYLYKCTDARLKCRGQRLSMDDPDTILQECVSGLIKGAMEHDILPMTLLPSEVPEKPVHGLHMCVLCQRAFAERTDVVLHMSPVNVSNGYSDKYILESGPAAIPCPIPTPSLQKLAWVDGVDKDGNPVRYVDESCLVWVPSGQNCIALMSRYQSDQIRYASHHAISREPVAFFVSFHRQIISLLATLKRYLGSNSDRDANFDWLLSDIKLCADIRVPDHVRLCALLPWRPSSHRPLQQLLALRISYLYAMLQVVTKEVTDTAKENSNMTRYMCSVVTRYMDILILTSIRILRMPDQMRQCIDIATAPECNVLHQLGAHEQTISEVISTARDYPLTNFIAVITAIVPISCKIIPSGAHITKIVATPDSVEAILLQSAIVMVLLWNTCMHQSDKCVMEPISLRARHILLSMPLRDLCVILQWDIDHPAKRPIALEVVLRVFWMRLVTMPRGDGQIGMVDPAGFIREYAGRRVWDVRSELVQQCMLLAGIRACIEQWASAFESRNGIFYSLVDGNGEPCLPNYNTLLLGIKRNNRAKPGKQAAASADVQLDASYQQLKRKTDDNTSEFPKKAAYHMIDSIIDMHEAATTQGNRPSEHHSHVKQVHADGTEMQDMSDCLASGITRRSNGQPPMRAFQNMCMIREVSRMPGRSVSLSALRNIGVSEYALGVLQTMLTTHNDEPLPRKDFDFVCKTILKGDPRVMEGTLTKRRRSTIGQKDMSLFILYLSALCRNMPPVSQELHRSVADAQETYMESTYKIIYGGIRQVPICRKCHVIAASPSTERMTTVRRKTDPRRPAENSHTVVLKRHTQPVQYCSESLLDGDERRRCPLCREFVSEESGTFVDIVGRVLHGFLVSDRMTRISMTMCIQCCSLTTASPDRRRGFGYCCVQCDAHVGKITPVCSRRSIVSHPTSGRVTFIVTPKITDTDVEYVVTCSHCDNIRLN